MPDIEIVSEYCKCPVIDERSLVDQKLPKRRVENDFEEFGIHRPLRA